MTLWALLSIVAAVAAFWIVVPFLARPRAGEVSDGAVALAKEQIRELDAEVGRGQIGADEARAARAEIERRLLAATGNGEAEMHETSDRARLIGIAVAAGWVVAGSVGLYAVVGQPSLPSGRAMPPALIARAEVQPPAAATGQSQVGGVDEMIAGLAARLDQNPDDAEGWRMLGWSYFQTGNYMASTGAYAKAVELDPSDPVIFSVYGEAMVRAGGGEVTDAALGVFHQALALDPNDPRARFFQGMALEQRGNPEGAIRLWAEVLDTAPRDADWAPGLRSRIDELATQIGFDLAQLDMPSGESLLPQQPASRGPTQADVAAAQGMSADDRQAMILGMVEGLSARLDDEPGDLEGWARLIRSYTVLNDPEAAKATLDRARTALGEDSPEYRTVADAAAELGIR